MKNIFFTILLLCTTSAAPAYSAPRVGPYIGADYTFNYLAKKSQTTQNWQTRSEVITPYVGFNFNEYVALEIGYNESDKKLKDINKTALQLRILYLDSIYRIHLDDRASLLATVGIADIEMVTPKGVTPLKTEKVSGQRLGVGYEYRLTNNLSARIKANYTGINSHEEFNSLFQYSAGVTFNF